MSYPQNPQLYPPMVVKKTTEKREKDEIISQCPECRVMKIWRVGQVYAPSSVPSVALFGDNVKKELCDGCTKKLSLALDL